jgi:hypothetical protein
MGSYIRSKLSLQYLDRSQLISHRVAEVENPGATESCKQKVLLTKAWDPTRQFPSQGRLLLLHHTVQAAIH